MISVALCTYNGEKFLREQLDSIFSQTVLPDEIVISDDNSKDKTIDIVQEYQSKGTIHVRLHQNCPGLGVYKNFERAISLCEGDYIFCCDQDDIWKPNKVEEFKKVIDEQRPTLVFSNAAVVLNEPSHYLYPLWTEKEMKDSEKGTSSFSTLIYRGGSIAGCCMAFRRDFVNSIMPFPDQVYHDDWIASCAAICGKIVPIHQELMYYRQHGNNVVGIIRGSKLSYWKSLLTNVRPYIEHREYIYPRHQKVYQGFRNHHLIDSALNKKLDENLLFTKHRSVIRQEKSLQVLGYIFSDMKNGYYSKYGKGIHEFFLDIYDLLVVFIFMRKKSAE